MLRAGLEYLLFVSKRQRAFGRLDSHPGHPRTGKPVRFSWQPWPQHRAGREDWRVSINAAAALGA